MAPSSGPDRGPGRRRCRKVNIDGADYYSNLSADYEGPGVSNFTAGPQFIDADDHIAISSTSSCIDRGDPASIQPDGPAPDVDFVGDSRPQGVAFDVGADEAR